MTILQTIASVLLSIKSDSLSMDNRLHHCFPGHNNDSYVILYSRSNSTDISDAGFSEASFSKHCREFPVTFESPFDSLLTIKKSQGQICSGFYRISLIQ